jgi:hypothetical protein
MLSRQAPGREPKERLVMAATEAGSARHHCAQCRFRRRRAEIVLFDAADLQTAGVLKEQVEWDQQRRQQAEQEAQLVASRQLFPYEPHHFDWCAAHPKKGLMDRAMDRRDAEVREAALARLLDIGSARVNPVSGKITPLFMACQLKNPDERCQDYEPG